MVRVTTTTLQREEEMIMNNKSDKEVYTYIHI